MKLRRALRLLASIASVAVAASCSSGNVAPSGLEAYSLRKTDVPAGARADARLSGPVSLPKLRDLLPIDQNVTLALKNAGFQTGFAQAFDLAVTPLACPTHGPCFGTASLYQSIALLFHSTDGAASSLHALAGALRSYGATLMTSPAVGDETASYSGGPSGLTPQAWGLWRRRNVLVILRASPAPGSPSMFRIATAIDARAPRT